jgi:hypothetical protein
MMRIFTGKKGASSLMHSVVEIWSSGEKKIKGSLKMKVN